MEWGTRARTVYKVVKTLSGKTDKNPPVDLNVHSETDKLIADAKEHAAVWYTFLRKKFTTTEKEKRERPAMEHLPERDPENIITWDEVAQTVNKMKKHKAVGADGIPVEVYQVSTVVFDLLYEMLTNIWKTESVPEELEWWQYLKCCSSIKVHRKIQANTGVLACSTLHLKFCLQLCCNDW